MKTFFKAGAFLRVFLAISVTAAGAQRVATQEAPSSTGVPVHMVVTVEPRHGSSVPAIYREDVMVYQGRDRLQVVDWVALQGDQSRLELFLLLDDASSPSLGSQLEDLRAFINSQSPNTAIGVGYMRNGTVDIVQSLTKDHASAAKSLRLPLGSSGASSPYFSLVDFIKHWPGSSDWREILMVSDGIDRFGGGGPANPYVDSAIEEAQRAGIGVFAIYSPGVGHYGHSFWRMNWGQNYLSQLADETGGEAYYLALQAPISFTPYLDDLTHRLGHQYLLTFLAKPEKKAGIQRVRLSTEVRNVELVAADGAYVPAGP